MSLINDLLQDLEERRGGNQDRHEVFDGLSPAQGRVAKDMPGTRPVFILILVLAVLFVLAIFVSRSNVVQVVSGHDAVDNIVVDNAPAEQDDQPETANADTDTDTFRPLARTPGLKLDQALSLSVSDYVLADEQPDTLENTVRIHDVTTETSAGAVRANITLSKQSDYRVYALESPARVVVEIPHVTENNFEIDNSAGEFVKSIRSGIHGNYIRLVFDLAEAAHLQDKSAQHDDGSYLISLLLDNNADRNTSGPENRVATLAEEKETAAAVHNRQMEKKPRQNDKGTLAEKHYKEGLYKYRNGAFGDSIKSLTTAIRMDPDNVDARHLLASAYLRQDRVDLAAAILNESVERLPGSARLKKLYAQILYELGHGDKAVDILKTSMPSVEQEPEYHALLAGILQDEGRHEEAVNVYRSLTDFNTEESLWWMGLGISEEALGNNGDAIAAYRRALQTGSLSENLKQYVSKRIQSLSGERRT